MPTNEYIRNVKNTGWPRFAKRLWQRSFYDHVIRNDRDLRHTREYIITNPENWAKDEYYPKNTTGGRIAPTARTRMPRFGEG